MSTAAPSKATGGGHARGDQTSRFIYIYIFLLLILLSNLELWIIENLV